MSVTRPPERWSWEAYLEWEARQERRHELVDGEVRAMTGGTVAHDAIANTLRAELVTRLRNTPCRAQGPDLKVRAGRNGRYPDALIDCGTRSPDALTASEPVAVFEILSPGTAWLDQGLKLRDYDATETIQTYALIEATRPRALIYRRDASGRLSAAGLELLEGLDATITIPGLDLAISLRAIYADAGLDDGDWRA